MRILENIPLAPLTTLKVGGPARYFADAQTEEEVAEAVAYAAEQHLPLFVLGGGSNLVVSDEGWPGLVLRISIFEVAFQETASTLTYYVGAGKNWDEFVALAVSKNCAGIECLSGIPGTVGGTPVQNVGAYGQEVSATIIQVRVLEIATGKISDLSNADCGFEYRTSIFNTTARDKYIVLQVAYKLVRNGKPCIEYADIKNYFAALTSGKKPSLQWVRDAVRTIRLSKAMLIVPGDEDCRSAGSFFKNPIVNKAEAKRIVKLAAKLAPEKALPQYPMEGGMIKLAAAWLVEQAGFGKGFSRGPVGVSRKHALALVNRGGATAKDIVGLKNDIQEKVFDTWGVRLQPEPVFVGFRVPPEEGTKP